MRERYAPLVERVTDRAELDDVLRMMVSEAGELHSQIRPGDSHRPAPQARPPTLKPCWHAPQLQRRRQR